VSRLVFVLMLLVSVSFDGLISTPVWRSVRLWMDQVTAGSAVGDDSLSTLAFLLLALTTLVVFGLFAAAVAHTGGSGGSLTGSLSGLLPSGSPGMVAPLTSSG
jgi:ABC-type Fe3+ transport system permease subunit